LDGEGRGSERRTSRPGLVADDADGIHHEYRASE